MSTNADEKLKVKKIKLVVPLAAKKKLRGDNGVPDLLGWFSFGKASTDMFILEN